jgi:murein DD-endopeptidase MepM/ murein hydrolase activator NlpD
MGLFSSSTFAAAPVDAASALVSSTFGAQEGGLRSKPHEGIDFAIPVGTPVYAVDPGVIERNWYDEGGGGNVVYLKLDNGYRAAYLHLSQFLRKEGERVHAGQPIALSGNTGSHSTGAHLHFELRIPKEQAGPGATRDTRLDPTSWLPTSYRLKANLGETIGGNPVTSAFFAGVLLWGAWRYFSGK